MKVAKRQDKNIKLRLKGTSFNKKVIAEYLHALDTIKNEMILQNIIYISFIYEGLEEHQNVE
jgi:hypothetical protein